MILETASAERIEEKDIYKKIEWAGRICYKSLDKVIKNSFEEFIKKRIIRSGHYSVLEHADINIELDSVKELISAIPQQLKSQFYISDNKVHANVRAWREVLEIFPIGSMITSFPLLFGDIHIENDKNNFQFEILHKPFDKREDMAYGNRETVFITTTRDISHQIVRHRLLSISQESQRYCNYAKEKHGSSVRFIKPNFIQSEKDYKIWTDGRIDDEKEYFYFLKKAKPEEARNCLPNCVATDLVLTANLWEWKHIFDLRCTKEAQPEIRDLMYSLKGQFLSKYKGSEVEDFFL